MKSKRFNIGILFFAVFVILPFLSAFLYALLYSFGIIGVVNDGFTLKFWKTVLSSADFFRSFFYSATIAAVSTFLSVSGALWISLKFRKELERGIYSFLIYLPLAVPGIVTGFFTFQLLSKGGFFSRIAYKLGIISEANQFPEMVNDSYAIGMVLSFITLALPFFLLLFLNIYKNERVEELSVLAKSLGANKRQITRKVFLPLMLRKSWILIVLNFIATLGAYEVPIILGQQSPEMLSILILREIRQYDLTKMSEGYVIAVIYTLMVTVCVIFLFLSRKKSLHET